MIIHKKLSKLLLLPLAFAAFAVFFSCAQVAEEKNAADSQAAAAAGSQNSEEDDSIDYGLVSFGVKKTAERMALPQNIEISDLSYTLVFAPGDGGTDTPDAQTKSFDSYTELLDAVIALSRGDWSFHLLATKDGKAVYQSDIQQDIKKGNNHIDFPLKPAEGSDGSIRVTLSIPQGKGAAVTATLYLLTGAVKEAEKDISATETVSGGQSFYTYSLSGVLNGTYILTFTITGTDGSVNSYSEMVRVANGAESSSEITLAEDDLTCFYTLNFQNISDSAGISYWKSGRAPSTLSFKNNTVITLPSADALWRADAVFGGWYLDSSFTSPVTEVTLTADTTVYARWFTPKLYIKEGSTLDTSSSLNGFSEETALATLGQAVDQINNAVTTYNLSTTLNWTIYIDGTITDCADITSPKAASLLITIKQGAAGAFLNANNAGSVLTIDNSIPVTIETVTLTSGSSINGAGINKKGKGRLTLSGSIITSNTASSFGGAMYVSEGTVSLTDSLIISNAATSGGAIYMDTGTTLIVNDGTQIGMQGSGNSTTGESTLGMGGAVMLYNAAMYMKGGTIAYNTAEYGGGITPYNSNLYLSGGTITHNTAAEYGSAIYFLNGYLTFSGSALVDESNDIWIATYSVISVPSTLTSSSETVATITPSSYTEGTTILNGSAVSSECSRFAVTSNVGSEYAIDTDGELYLVSTGIFISQTTGDDTNGNGTYSKPYSTLTKAVTAFSTATAGISGTDTSPKFTNKIYVLSDYTITSGYGVTGEYYFELIGLKDGVNNASVTFTCNTPSDSAFEIANNQKIKFTNIDFTQDTGNVNSYVVILVDSGATFYLENSSFTGITANNSSVMQINGTTCFKNVTITGNTSNANSSGDSVWGPAVSVSSGSLTICDKVVITGNTMIYTDSSGTEVSEPMNIWIGGSDSTGAIYYNPIRIGGAITGSDISVTLYSNNVSTFTSGYAAYETQAPSTYFASDKGYAIAADSSGEACIGSTAGVTVTFAEYNDIEVLKEISGSTVTFTAAGDYDTYSWYIDDEAASSVSGVTVSSNVLTVNTSGWTKGVYDIVLEAYDATAESYRSFTAQITAGD